LLKSFHFNFRDNNETHQSEQFLSNQVQETNKQNVNTLFFIEDEDNVEIKNIKWPTIGQFTIDLAVSKIEEFMKNVAFSIQ
jgi:hypothetical protein